MKNDNKGFSLIELIVVIAIMAILVGALAPQFVKYIEKTNISTDMQNVAQIKTAVEVYAADASTAAAGYTAVNIKVGNSKIVVDGGPTGMDAAALGLPALTVNLKSKYWPTTAVTYTFSADYTWGTPAECKNTKDTTKDMASIFKN